MDKTKYVSFSIRGTVPLNPSTDKIILHECPTKRVCMCSFLECVKSVKYLGVIIDSNLNSKEHIKHLYAKIRKLMFVFIMPVAEPLLMKQIYYALYQSLLT